MALSGESPQTIEISLQDKGISWLDYSTRGKNWSIDIDLKNVSTEKSKYSIETLTLQKLIQEQLLPTSLIRSFSPEKIEIAYSPLEKKELPVAIVGTLAPAFGYTFSDSIRIAPAVVEVFGDKMNLDTLSVINTVSINKNNITKELDVWLDLSVPKGLRLSSEKVKLTANVEEYTEKKFEFPIVCYNLPANRIVRFFPSSVELSVHVGLSKYKEISKQDFDIRVDYNDLIKNDATNYTLRLTRKPKWLVDYRIVPETVEFLVEEKNNNS
ncbi:hypothetical protein FACS1894123_03300 [Bacteroidia bacterium]|nr:hypothetical protein FACS1894123_03300 [Bacteroidia bacterium]